MISGYFPDDKTPAAFLLSTLSNMDTNLNAPDMETYFKASRLNLAIDDVRR